MSSSSQETTPASVVVQPFFDTVQSVLIGQKELVESLLIGLLTDGHILLEGVPGLAKTLAVRTVSSALALGCARIQFTPDLLPADLIGTQIYNPRTGEFSVKRGPIFANIVLADEINRAPAKVQSALLEAMQEHQVTIGDDSLALPKPFFVLATQNPLDQEGTYPLPEAQVDRFMMKVLVTYPSKAEELEVLARMGSVEAKTNIEPVMSPEQIADLRGRVDRLHVDSKINGYIVDLVRATRNPKEYQLELEELIQIGASPRAVIAFVRAAKAHALLRDQTFVLPADVKAVAHRVLRHRLILTYEAEAQELTADELITRIVEGLPLP